MFKLFGIPTYAVFDSDANLNKNDQKLEVNLGIQTMQDEENPKELRTFVGSGFASFEQNLEQTLKVELGDVLDEELRKASYKYGLKQKRLMKNPIALSEILNNCYKAGAKSLTFESIIDNIISLGGNHDAKL